MKRLAVSTRIVNATGYSEPRDALAQDWVAFFDARGVLPILVPNTLSSPETFAQEMSVDGVLLTGGNMVGLEGETAPPADVKPERDRTENALIEFAIEKSLPVLGVCRGMQMLNRYFGGSVTRNISALEGVSEDHVATEHDIRLTAGDWRTLAGAETVRVNSFHDDGILKSDLAEILNVAAESMDGQLIEGFAHPDLPLFGIEWHVERPSPSSAFDRALFARIFGDS